MKELYLTKVKAKQNAIIKELQGGHGISARLESLGIRPGKKITMISMHPWRGPVTIMIGKSKVAIGHGVAQKILVEAIDEPGK